MDATNKSSCKSCGISITPHMLHAAVRKLQMRRAYVSTKVIGQYLRRCYPVEKDAKEFKEELVKKLTCAVSVGLLVKCGEDSYCLPTLRQEANLHKTAVSAFWEMYNKKDKLINPRGRYETKQSSTSTDDRKTEMYDSDNSENASDEDFHTSSGHF